MKAAEPQCQITCISTYSADYLIIFIDSIIGETLREGLAEQREIVRHAASIFVAELENRHLGLTLVISMKAVLFLGAPLGGEEDLLTCITSS